MVTSSLKRGLLIATVSLSALVAAHGTAQAANTFKPASNWAVNRIDTAGAAPYCTLARRFDNNAVVTFARNTKGEGTIAIDFQRQAFNPQQTYTVQLNPGNNDGRSFEVRPATQSAIILKTGEDGDFYSALSRSNNLEVSIAGVTYNFALNNFSAGSGQIEGCLGNAASASRTAGRAAAPVTREAVVPPVPVSAAPDPKLMAELNSLKSQNATLSRELDDQRKAFATRVAQPDPAEEAKNREAMERMAKLERENSDLIAQLSAAQSKTVATSRDDATVRAALAEQQELKDTLESERQQRAALERVLADTSRKGETAKASSGNARTAAQSAKANAELAGRIRDLETRNRDLEQKLAAKAAEPAAAMSPLAVAAAAPATSGQSLEELQAEQARRMAAERELSATRVTLSDSQDRLAQLEKERQGLLKTLEDERADFASKMKTTAAAPTTDPRAAEVAGRLAAVEARNTELMGELETARVRVKNAENAASRMANSGSAPAPVADGAVIARAEAQTAELREMLDSERARREKLEGMMASAAQAPAAPASAPQNQARTAEMDRQIISLQQKNAGLEQELQAARNLAARAPVAVPQYQAPAPRDDAALMQAQREAAEKSEALIAAEAEKQALRSQLNRIASAAPVAAPSVATKVETRNVTDPALVAERDQLRRQIDVLKKDNEMLAARRETASDARRETASATPALVPAPVPPQPVPPAANIVVNSEGEASSQLQAVVAERDEYRDLLQRERMREKPGKGQGGAVGGEDVRKLEAEKADLIRKLEYERARLASISAGLEPAPSASEQAIRELGEAREALKASQAERDALRSALNKQQAESPDAVVAARQGDDPRISTLLRDNAQLKQQLAAAQEDVIAARGIAKQVAPVVADAAPTAKGAPAARDVATLTPIPPRTAGSDEAKTFMRDAQVLANENRRLEGELAQARNGNGEFNAMQAEIAALQAQNKILTQEVNQRGAATMQVAKADDQVARTQARYNAAEQENIRLARDLATARNMAARPQPAPAPEPAPESALVADTRLQQRFEAAEQENIRLARTLAAERTAKQGAIAQASLATGAAPAAPSVATGVVPASVSASAPVAQASRAVVQPVAVAQNHAAENYDGRDIAAYLTRAGVQTVEGVQKVRNASNADRAAFRWDTGTVFGSAEQSAAGDTARFESAVSAYLTRTRNRCTGAFDQTFDGVKNLAGKPFAVADLACVLDDGTGAGAAVVFFEENGVMNVVAHEGDLDHFTDAMNTRDQFAGFIKTQM